MTTRHTPGRTGTLGCVQCAAVSLSPSPSPSPSLSLSLTEPEPEPEHCSTPDLVVDWLGGFHASGHAIFGATRIVASGFLDAQVAIADPLDGCMGAAAGAAVDPVNIIGNFADGSIIGKVALCH